MHNFWPLISVLLLLQGYCSEALVYEKFKKLCNNSPPITRKHENTIKWLLRNVGEASLTLSTSPQHEAACWTIRERRAFSPQRFVLATLYFATKGVNWEANALWVTHKHECSWYGVQCNIFKKVIGLDLGFIKVDGLVPRELGLLPELKDLDLHGNDLQGVIPHKLMAGLKKLEYFRLHMNGMFGSIHKEIANMVNLKELHLFGNYMGGTLPTELSRLKKLEVLDLYANMLEGTIPKEIAKLPKLRVLDVHDNNFVGTMPREICNMKLDALVADCYGPKPEVRCDCCTVCCQGLPKMVCVDAKTGQQVEQVY